MTGALSFAPLVPLWVIGLVMVAMAAPVVIMLMGAKTGSTLSSVGLRLTTGLLISLMLANPSWVREARENRSDIALVMIDRSLSLKATGRNPRTDRIRDALVPAIAALPNMEARVVELGPDPQGRPGTALMAAIARAEADIPTARHAGTIIISDGQVHDQQITAARSRPMHLLVNGRPDEWDRRIVIESLPGYAIVGTEASMRFRVDDLGPDPALRAPRQTVEVVMRTGQAAATRLRVPVGVSVTLAVPIDHRGPNPLELSVAPRDGEISPINNRTARMIIGVRQRLRVLLVSGQPHPGERMWRNLLKSDPSVDLVHFTILRPSYKRNFVPLNELALIRFPVDELFGAKLDKFDLVIMDRYRLQGVIRPVHWARIGQYVRDGGALLAALGPSFTGPDSLANTELARVLPIQPAPPDQARREGPFKPSLSPPGRRHPITEPFGTTGAEASWGRWFRQIDGQVTAGVTLMRGADDKALLQVARVENGRVGQLMSDHAWLWTRGYDGGGPAQELLHRLAHWLMKEPDLEEEAMRATAVGEHLRIEHRSLSDQIPTLTVTTPTGTTMTTTAKPNGVKSIAQVPLAGPGLYTIDDGARRTVVAVGPPAPLEYQDLRATDEKLTEAVAASGGGIAWIRATTPLPTLRTLRAPRPGQRAISAGKNWLGLVRNGTQVVVGLTQRPIFYGLLGALIGLAALAMSWWRESR